MRAYMGYGGDPVDGAVVVFAHTAREARRLAWLALLDWSTDYEWIEVRAKWLRGDVTHHADPEKLARGEPHVVEPDVCGRCELWYAERLVDGLCKSCATDALERSEDDG